MLLDPNDNYNGDIIRSKNIFSLSELLIHMRESAERYYNLTNPDDIDDILVDYQLFQNETDLTRIESPMVYIQYDTRSTIHSPMAFPLFMVNSSYIDMGPFSDPDIISLKLYL